MIKSNVETPDFKNSVKTDVEKKDVHAKWTRLAAGALALSLIVIAFFVYAIYGKRIGAWRDLSGSTLESRFPDPKVFWPGAKAEPVTDITYKWNSESHTTAEIPVSRAVELAASRQLIHLKIQTEVSK